MKNFVSPGQVVALTAPAGGVQSGQPLLIGSIFGVAVASAAEGSAVQLSSKGVFELPKATGQTWSEGGKIYWSSANSHLTTTATNNKLVGVAAAAAASTADIGLARIGYHVTP